MWRFWKIEAHLKKKHLEEWGAFGKMRHIWKNETHMGKYVTFGRMWHTGKRSPILKNMAHMEICGAFGKCGALEKCGAFGKMRHIWNNVAHLVN